MLVVMGAIGMAIFLFVRMDDEIRYQAEQFLAEKLPQYNVSVGGARLVEGKGIAIYDLAISETSSTHLQSNLLVVDEVMLVCDAKLSKLVQGAPEIQRIVFKRPQLWATRDSEGRWNVDSLWPLPPCGETRPLLEIQDAQLALADLQQSNLPALSLQDVNFIVDPRQSAAQPTQSGMDPQDCQTFDIHGSLGGPYVKRAEFHIRMDMQKKLLQLESQFEQLRLTKEWQVWATACCNSLADSTLLEGMLDGNVTAQHQFVEDAQPQINAQLQLSEGRLADPRLPRPLTDIAGSIQCQNNVLKVTGLRAKCDAASVALQLERKGWHANAPMALGLRVVDLPLDKKLHHALPMLLKKEWKKYQPAGIVNADVGLTFDGHHWRPDITLRGRELSFESEKFRYRVQDGSGTMRYKHLVEDQQAVLHIDLVGIGGGQPLRFFGKVFDPRPGALGFIEITGNGLTIEKRMIAALPVKTRQVIESMRPQGHFNVRWRLDRTQPGQIKPHTSLRLELLDCRANYKHFPYPLSGIHGLILAEDQNWKFRDLIASGSRNVSCQGTLRPLGDGRELSLQFTCKQLLLEDDLKKALPAKVRAAWDEVRPGGRADLVANVYHLTGYKQPAIRVSVNPQPESATIYPVFFPYLLKQVEGRFDYINGELLITDFRGKHGLTTLLTNGNGNFASDGSWQFELTGLSADRLEPRRDLLTALPEKLRKLIEQLQITGKFSLHNTALKFSKTNQPDATINSSWDVQLSCMQTDMHPGIDLQNVHGTVRLVGSSENGMNYSAGELALETVTFEGVQFTNIRGPLWADETSCLLGEWATKRQGLTPRRVTAKVYDGSLVSDAWVTFDGVPRYSVVASLAGADLPRMTKERFNTEQNMQGKVGATLTLNGYGRSLHTLTGHGQVQVTEANIYELPLLVGLLKVLRNTTPDSTAFNQVDTKYRIEGRHIYLDQLDFLGDAVSLLGKGETNFDQQLNLAFHGVVGRNEIRLPFVKNFFDQVGQQTLQMYVDGTLANPQVHKQALPGINQLIQQIQTDLDTNSPGTYTPQRKAERTIPMNQRLGTPK